MSKLAIPTLIVKNGRITIPLKIREKMGLKDGDSVVVEYELGNDFFLVRKSEL
jgi:AbrB family looped-hinge helix DNA binding protein